MAAISSPTAAGAGAASSASATPTLGEVRGRVLCSYDPRDPSELALTVDEVVLAREDASLPAGWMMARIGGREGKVQQDYLDFDDVDN